MSPSIIVSLPGDAEEGGEEQELQSASAELCQSHCSIG